MLQKSICEICNVSSNIYNFAFIFNANLHRGCCFARREQVHKLLANYFNSYHKMWFFRNETMFSEA